MTGCSLVHFCTLSLEQQAAWTQALGTVAAILVAIAAPIWHSRRLAFQRDRRAMQAIGALASYATDQLETYVNRYRGLGPGARSDKRGLADLRRLAHALAEIPAHTLPDDRLIYPLLRLREDVDVAVDSYAAIHKGEVQNNGLADGVMRANRGIEAAEELVTIYREYEWPWLVRTVVWNYRGIFQRARATRLAYAMWKHRREKRHHAAARASGR